MNLKRRWLIKFAAFLALGVASSTDLAWSAGNEEPTEITIALASNSMALGGVRIAEQAHLFERHGIEAHIVVMENANSSIAALISGSAQFANSGPDDALFAMARGQPITIIAELYKGLSAFVVVSTEIAEKSGVKPDGPIEDRLRALDGVTMAVPSATTVLIPLIRGPVESVGGKLNFTYMAQSTMAAALQSGAISSFFASSPNWEPAVASGKAVLWISAPSGELPKTPPSGTVLSTMRPYAEANPDVVARMRAVLEDVGDLIDNDPEQAKAALAKAYPSLSPEVLDSVFEQNSPNWRTPKYTEDDMRTHIKLATEGGAKDFGKVDPAIAVLKW